jgi:hypothetical protein
MAKQQSTDTKDAPLLAWMVSKTPAGSNTLKVGDVRAGKGGILKLTREQADTLNKALPGCLEFQGI